MVNDIFPRKTNNMPDDIWETYCCMVWCCNSLNAQEGSCRHKGDYDNENMFKRAQDVIWFLLKESGRIETYDKWEKNKEDNE